jgi:phosphoglycerate dehydrogenase-like enzyme
MIQEKPLVWISEMVAPSVVTTLGASCEVALGYGQGARTFASVAEEVVGVMLRKQPMTAEMIASAPHLAIIARHGVGYDAVDVDAATARGVMVTNAPGVNAQSVAELAVGLLLALFHRVPHAAHTLSLWQDPRLEGQEAEGAELCVIGAGAIGRRVAQICQAVGMRITFALTSQGDDREARTRRAAHDLKADAAPLDEALARCSAVSVHVPLTSQTHHLLDSRRLSLIPEGGIVINTARGGIVDDEALADLLASGRLAGAGLDCTEVEPCPQNHRLRTLDNVIVTPHIGSQTQQTLHKLGMSAAQAILDCLAGKRPAHVIESGQADRRR